MIGSRVFVALLGLMAMVVSSSTLPQGLEPDRVRRDPSPSVAPPPPDHPPPDGDPTASGYDIDSWTDGQPATLTQDQMNRLRDQVEQVCPAAGSDAAYQIHTRVPFDPDNVFGPLITFSAEFEQGVGVTGGNVASAIHYAFHGNPNSVEGLPQQWMGERYFGLTLMYAGHDFVNIEIEVQDGQRNPNRPNHPLNVDLVQIASCGASSLTG